MRKKVLEQEFIRLNADYKALLDETIQLREKVATADEALEKMRATEENVRSIHENTRRLKHDMRNHLMVIAMSLGNEKYDENHHDSRCSACEQPAFSCYAAFQSPEDHSRQRQCDHQSPECPGFPERSELYHRRQHKGQGCENRKT